MLKKGNVGKVLGKLRFAVVSPRYLTICFLLFLPFSVFPAKYFVTINNLKFRVDDIKEEAVCVGLASEDTERVNLNVPSRVTYKNKQYPVTEIASEAFRGSKKIKSIITLPATLRKIGDYAFSRSSVSGQLSLPSSLRIIGKGAFEYGEKLTGSLTIPDTVEEIGEYAFCYCEGFKGKLRLGKSLKIIGNSAFDSCRGLSGSLIIPDGVTYIGNFAFSLCEGFTENLVIGDGVLEIGEEAFAWCSNFRGELTIGRSVKVLGRYAFNKCRGFCGSIIIPDTVVEIEDGVFCECSGFDEKLEIGKSVSIISHSAFKGCDHIQEIVCLAPIPPEVYQYGGMEDFIFEKLTLFVPQKSEEKYRQSDVWGLFRNIKPIIE